MINYILKDDVPVPTDDWTEWARWMQDHDSERHVARDSTMVGNDEIMVSTAFLGIDHGCNFNNDSNYVPWLWETMIFGGDHDGEQRRYTSALDARAGHNELLLLAHHKKEGVEDE